MAQPKLFFSVVLFLAVGVIISKPSTAYPFRTEHEQDKVALGGVMEIAVVCSKLIVQNGIPPRKQ